MIRDLLTYTEGDVDDLEYDLVRLDEYGTPFEIQIRYTIDNLVTLTPEEVLFQTGGLLSPASLSSFKVDTRERTLPIRIYYDRITNKTIRLRFPEAWALTTALEGVEYENRFGGRHRGLRRGPGRGRRDPEGPPPGEPGAADGVPDAPPPDRGRVGALRPAPRVLGGPGPAGDRRGGV